MASFQISPPQFFNFALPDEWPRWIRRFERFREASGLKGKEQASQVNTGVLHGGRDRRHFVFAGIV